MCVCVCVCECVCRCVCVCGCVGVCLEGVYKCALDIMHHVCIVHVCMGRHVGANKTMKGRIIMFMKVQTISTL